jgi:hypothetical protein
MLRLTFGGRHFWWWEKTLTVVDWVHEYTQFTTITEETMDVLKDPEQTIFDYSNRENVFWSY